MARGKKPNVGKLIAIVIICIIGSVGATYFIINQNNQTDIDNYKIEISELNKKINNQNECFRYFAKASSKVEDAFLNHGVAETYTEQGTYYFGLDNYESSESFYKASMSYYNFSIDFFEESITQLNYAKNFAKNEELMDYINQYIEYIDLYKDFSNINFQLTDKMRLASYYYNMSDLDSGDKKIIEYNDQVNENANLLNELKTSFDELESLLENDWKI